jgi:hypothetical protein
MTVATQQLAFIIPPAVDEKSSMVHSSCYRLALNILSRAEQEPVAIIIEKMHYTALIYEEKICFADNSRTILHSGKKAHPVTMEWRFLIAEDRNSNEQHIPMMLRFHENNLSQVQQELTGEFYKAMMDTDERFSHEIIPSQKLDVISLSSFQSDH